LAQTCSICIAELKMSSSGSASREGVKRQRESQEEEDAPALLENQMTVHNVPLALLAVIKSYHRTLVCAQLCNPQGVFLFSHVCLPPRVSRPFAGAAVYDMSLTQAERLCAVGCGLKGQIVRLLSLCVGSHFEPQRNRLACLKMMQSVVRRVAAGLAAAVRDKVAKEAAELCAAGLCAAALVPLQRAIYLGDLPSLARKAWLLTDDRLNVEGMFIGTWPDPVKWAEEGARLGCHHCQGVLAYLLFTYCQDQNERSLTLARESAGRGSWYGQVALGLLFQNEGGGQGLDVYDANYVQAVAFFRLAAVQGFDGAQFALGEMYANGWGVAQNNVEAMRLFLLAAAQGHPEAMWHLSCLHRAAGRGEMASFWLKRAMNAHCFDAICYHYNE